MSLSLKPERLKRYKDIVRLLIRHGQRDLLRAASLEQELVEIATEEGGLKGSPEDFTRDLEALGPTFIKLGQMLSTRPDLLPQPYIDALARLQDQAEPLPFERVEEVVSSELGMGISDAFAEFDREPLGSASLGQVHRARLGNGHVVAVKVQRPDIRKTVIEDIEALKEIASTVDRHTEVGRRYAFEEMLAEFRRSLISELDYVQEAQNLEKFRQVLESYPDLVVPRPVNEYTTSRVLTMDLIEGVKIGTLGNLTRLELGGEGLLRDLLRGYLDQVLIEGFFHADPHPGNVLLTPEKKLGLIDLGMVARVDPRTQDALLKLLLALSNGQGSEAAELLVKISVSLEDHDMPRFRRRVADLVGRYQDSTLGRLRPGRVIMELARASAESGFRPAPELLMLGKTLVCLDEVGRILAPDLRPQDIVRSHADSAFRRHMLRSLAPGNLLSSFLELNEFVQKLPGRLNDLLDSLAANRLEVKVRALDEARLTQNLQKIANRIAMGLVLAALIIGAALLMQIETSLTVFGYPVLALALFLVAAGCGFALVFSVLLSDERRRRRGPPR